MPGRPAAEAGQGTWDRESRANIAKDAYVTLAQLAKEHTELTASLAVRAQRVLTWS